MVADSFSSDGIRLTTIECRYPRFIHAELMTHRMFSRNASSSRAVPVEKMLQQVKDNTAMPIHWGKNQPGMQADEELDSIKGEMLWKMGRHMAVKTSEDLLEEGYHKQIANRVTEPFQFIKVIITATEWDNFFKLRLHKDAQPEIHELARCMKEAMDTSEPTVLHVGEWHLPYLSPKEYDIHQLESIRKASVGRLAKVSYDNHNKGVDIEKDVALHDRLLEAGHMSPFEHVATPMREPNAAVWETGVTHIGKGNKAWSGNFRGWIQYRQTLKD